MDGTLDYCSQLNKTMLSRVYGKHRTW